MFYMASEQAEADGLDVETNVDKADAEPKKDLPLLPVDSIVQLLLRAKKQLKLQEAAQYLVGKAGGSPPPPHFQCKYIKPPAHGVDCFVWISCCLLALHHQSLCLFLVPLLSQAANCLDFFLLAR